MNSLSSTSRADGPTSRFPWTVGVTVLVSSLEAARDALAPGLSLPLDALPLADLGLGWVLPAALAAAVSCAVTIAARRLRAGRAPADRTS